MASHPGADLSGVHTGSGLRAYMNTQRLHALAACDAYRTAATTIQRNIERMGKGSWLGMPDPTARIRARRIVRPLRHAADLAEDQARMFTLVMKVHDAAFAPQSTSNTTYDPSK